MKTIIKILLLSVTINLCIICRIFAQYSDTIIARAYYNYEHMLDTMAKNKIYKEDMLLVLGKNTSLYTSLSKIQQIKQLELQQIDQVKNNSSASNMLPIVTFNVSRFTSSTEYYKFNDVSKLYIKRNLIRDYLYEDSLSTINWNIKTDTASFKGILCQKAVTHFKGRNWIAWFSTELPFQSGPWLLSGLPGLIIEAVDDKNEVAFHFAGFEKALVKQGTDVLNDEFKNIDYTKATIISLPKERLKYNNKIKVVYTTKKNFLKLVDMMNLNYKAFIDFQIQSTGGIVYDEEAYQTIRLTPKTNNPIEIKPKI